MGTHPSFESDFDCLTDVSMISIGSLRKLTLTASRQRTFREGYGVIHGKHMLPQWEGTKMKPIVTNDGHRMEIAEYDPKPFHMTNLVGAQPASESNPMKFAEGYGSMQNTELKRNVLVDYNHRSVKVTQYGGKSLLQRTGYMIDLFRQSKDLRNHKDVYYEKIIKMVEDHNASRHLALVCGNGDYHKLGPRWIPATENMKEGHIILNDGTGKYEPNPVPGGSYKLLSLPIGTKFCFAEKVPGRGAELAMSQGRYGQVMGRIDRKAEAPEVYKDVGKWRIKQKKLSRRKMWERRWNYYPVPPKPDPLVIVSFPYLSQKGYMIDVGNGKKERMNYKGDLDKNGLHERMGGRQDETWNKGEVTLKRFASRNSKEEGSKFGGEWKSYYRSMATHRENQAEMSPEYGLEQDFILHPECVVTVGVPSGGGLMTSQLLSQTSTLKHQLWGGYKSSGYKNKMIRKSGKQHVTSFYRRFKTQSQLLVQTEGDVWKNVQMGRKQKLTKEQKQARNNDGGGLIHGRDRKLSEKALKKLKGPRKVPKLGPHQY